MTCPNQGCEYPEGECLFDEVCDSLDEEMFTEIALGCESIVDDEIEDDVEDDGDIESPLHVITNTLHYGKHEAAHSCPCSKQAREIIAALTAAGWHFNRL